MQNITVPSGANREFDKCNEFKSDLVILFGNYDTNFTIQGEETVLVMDLAKHFYLVTGILHLGESDNSFIRVSNANALFYALNLAIRLNTRPLVSITAGAVQVEYVVIDGHSFSGPFITLDPVPMSLSQVLLNNTNITNMLYNSNSLESSFIYDRATQTEGYFYVVLELVFFGNNTFTFTNTDEINGGVLGLKGMGMHKCNIMCEFISFFSFVCVYYNIIYKLINFFFFFICI
jgi:hypothetical protein